MPSRDWGRPGESPPAAPSLQDLESEAPEPERWRPIPFLSSPIQPAFQGDDPVWRGPRTEGGGPGESVAAGRRGR